MTAATIPSIAVFDDSGPLQPAQLLELQSPKRRRGRPFGAKAKITAPSAGINACETAFLRAVVQGIAPKAAAAGTMTSCPCLALPLTSRP